MSLFFEMDQIGPNVSMSANARIGAGSRLIGCIVLDEVEIKVGMNLFVGRKLEVGLEKKLIFRVVL